MLGADPFYALTLLQCLLLGSGTYIPVQVGDYVAWHGTLRNTVPINV